MGQTCYGIISKSQYEVNRYYVYLPDPYCMSASRTGHKYMITNAIIQGKKVLDINILEFSSISSIGILLTFISEIDYSGYMLQVTYDYIIIE